MVMAADRPYGEFYDFYNIIPEYFEYILVYNPVFSCATIYTDRPSFSKLELRKCILTSTCTRVFVTVCPKSYCTGDVFVYSQLRGRQEWGARSR
jgi:hypothetical protein